MTKPSDQKSAKARILVVEDDSSLLFGLQKNLEFEGYDVLVASDGESGLQKAIDDRPDLIVLDVMLPRMNGFEVCEVLRKNDIDTPVIFLTAKSLEGDKILGLELGADDYMTKPFSVGELLARIKVVLRRVQVDAGEVHRFGEVEVAVTGRVVRARGADVELTSMEFELLLFMVRNVSKVLPRDTILQKVWGFNYYGTARTIDNFINRLRHKIEEDPMKPKHIQTVRGVGYKFSSGDE